jgi:deoxyribodipyrimidine photo-lyase
VGSRTAVVLLTRDLRLHDHPALDAACRRADVVVVLFVLDDALLASRYAAPNRVAFLLEALGDVREGLRSRGGDLVVRRGDTLREVGALLDAVAADELHVSDDVSVHADRRARGLDRLARQRGCRFERHPGVTVADPGAITTSGGGAYQVFTPYWRRWSTGAIRVPVPTPGRVPGAPGLDPGPLPGLGDLVGGATSRERMRGGEVAALARLDGWLDAGITGYEEGRDRLGEDATSRLSPHLHLGCVSPTAIVARLDRRRRGHDAFLRQLCWRDFNHQLLAAHGDLVRTDLRDRGDDWTEDPEAVAAWKAGRTGYPVVDAGMRQLLTEGWMHNRARMLTASFLTKHLRVDWRVGAWHFMDWLVDGDLANNFAQWQWVAGTGTDARPNRVPNPVAQGRRHDPSGTYVRRHVPELAAVDDRMVHEPRRARGSANVGDYPPPLVDHDEARARFLDQRGRSRPPGH